MGHTPEGTRSGQKRRMSHSAHIIPYGSSSRMMESLIKRRSGGMRRRPSRKMREPVLNRRSIEVCIKRGRRKRGRPSAVRRPSMTVSVRMSSSVRISPDATDGRPRNPNEPEAPESPEEPEATGGKAAESPNAAIYRSTSGTFHERRRSPSKECAPGPRPMYGLRSQ